MKKESLNYNLQLVLFPGICVFGLILSLIFQTITFIPFLYGISTFLRAVFAFFCNIYGKGHWYSKKERIFDGIVFIVIGVIGEIEIILYITSR